MCQFAGFRDNEEAYHDAAKRSTKMNVGILYQICILSIEIHLAEEVNNSSRISSYKAVDETSSELWRHPNQQSK
jgi:hypothetical protein